MLCPVGDRMNCRQSILKFSNNNNFSSELFLWHINTLTCNLSLPQRLPQQINERNEKLKEEMLSECCKSLFYENFMTFHVRSCTIAVK